MLFSLVKWHVFYINPKIDYNHDIFEYFGHIDKLGESKC